jgi:hypothetical protein
MSDRSYEVHNRVESVRLATLRQRLVVDAACFVGVALSVAAAIAVVDYFLVLAMQLRVLAAVVSVAGLVAGFVWVSRRRRNYQVSDAAADVEAEYTEYGQRIRTTLDYTDPEIATATAAPSMVQALTVQTRERFARDDFTGVVSTWPIGLAMTGLAVVLVGCLAALIANPESWISAGRTMLLPIHYSKLTVTPILKPVPAGEDVSIVAEISGRAVEDAAVHYRPLGTSDEWKELSLEPVEGNEVPEAGLSGKLIATLEECGQSLEFRVAAGQFESKVYQIEVLQPLEMQSFNAHVQPPLYTGLKPETVDKMDLKVVEGTEVEFDLALNREPEEAHLVPVGGNAAGTAAPELKIKGNMLSGELGSLTASQQFIVSARAADGMSFESSRFRIHVRPDGKPKIRFVRPPEDLEVTPTTEVPLAIHINDDFGVRKLGVMAQVGDGAMETLWEKEFEEPGTTRESRAAPMLFLEEHEVTFQDSVTYYAFVEDNRPGDARRTTTELRFIDIRPYKREYQILEGGGT